MSLQKKLNEAAIADSQYGFRPNLFIWPNMTLLFGPLQHLNTHAIGSLAINIGLYQPFFAKTLTTPYTPYRCAIIPADCQHQINAKGHIMASLIIEKNSLLYPSVKKYHTFSNTYITEIINPELINCLQKIHEGHPSKNEIESHLNQSLHITEKLRSSIDPRITQAMRILQASPESYPYQKELASHLGLSTSRFRHLFREHSDIPFRRYRIWRRTLLSMSSLH